MNVKANESVSRWAAVSQWICQCWVKVQAHLWISILHNVCETKSEEQTCGTHTHTYTDCESLQRQKASPWHTWKWEAHRAGLKDDKQPCETWWQHNGQQVSVGTLPCDTFYKRWMQENVCAYLVTLGTCWYNIKCLVFSVLFWHLFLQ